MNRREFFNTIFGDDPQGWICIRGIYFKPRPGQGPYHIWAKDFDEADQAIEHFQSEGREPYYVPGLFKEKGDKYSGATASNVKSHRSFYVDIDCGPDAKKPYKTQKEGLAALQQFLTHTGLPMPTLVSSGYGIHCYWIMDRDIPYDLWKPAVMGLVAKANEYQFETDRRVIGDGASLLRPPDSFNTKNPDEPKQVKVRHAAPVMTLESFQRIIPVALTHGTVNTSIDPMTSSLMGDYPSCSFDVLLRKSLITKQIKVPVKKIIKDKDGNDQAVLREEAVEACAGCQQIKKCYDERAHLDYDMWLLALSVAQFCTDADEAIQLISEGHPDYDAVAVAKKAASLNKGPAACTAFQQKNPDGCIGCVHRTQGKIKGPISLGRSVELSTASDLIIENVIHEGLPGETTVEAPLSYPPPWARPRQGGVVRRDFDEVEQAEEAGESMETFVYGNDLWVKELMQDEDEGMALHMVHVQPFGPHQKRAVQFMIPYEEIAKQDTLQKRLAHHGVHGAFFKGTTALLQQYIQAWVVQLEREAKPGIARAHYGWHDGSFVVGKREYVANMSPTYSPPSKATAHTADAFDPVGSLAEWVEMANLYGAPGNEAKAFTMFIAYGAPLYKFLELGSCLVHLSNKESGVGKSTNQRVGASVWGDPKELMLLKTDTDNARYHQMGVYRHLPVWIDEITNMDPDELSELAYRISENRGKHRQYSHSNSLRRNQTKWETIVVSSGNNSLYDTLKQHRINLGGEMNRIIELNIDVKDALTQEEASHWYEHVLPNNYGLAGHIYAQYLADMEDDLKRETFETYQSYVKKFNFKRQHRFFRGVCAAVFTGARAAKALGLHNIDVDRVEAWAIQQLGDITAVMKESVEQDALQTLGQFINENKRNELIVNHGEITAGGLAISEMPVKEPLGRLVMRMERDTERLYIASAPLRSWCADHRAHFDAMILEMKAKGVLISSSQFKALAAGTASPGVSVRCIVIDMAKVHILNSDLAAEIEYPLQ